MKLIFAAAFTLSIGTLVGCGSEAGSPSVASGPSEEAQARLDEIQSKVTIHPDGTYTGPPADFQLPTENTSMTDALSAIPQEPGSPIIDMRNICAGGYGSPMVCCTATGCCVVAGAHYECWGTSKL